MEFTNNVDFFVLFSQALDLQSLQRLPCSFVANVARVERRRRFEEENMRFFERDRFVLDAVRNNEKLTFR